MHSQRHKRKIADTYVGIFKIFPASMCLPRLQKDLDITESAGGVKIYPYFIADFHP